MCKTYVLEQFFTDLFLIKLFSFIYTNGIYKYK